MGDIGSTLWFIQRLYSMYSRVALPGRAMYMTYAYLSPLDFVCSAAVLTEKSPHAVHRTSTNVNVGKSCLPGDSCPVPFWG